MTPSDAAPSLSVKLRSTLSTLLVSASKRAKLSASVEGFRFALTWPEANNGMAPLTVTLPDGRARTGLAQRRTAGRSMWIRDNAHRLTPEAVDLLVMMCLRNAETGARP